MNEITEIRWHGRGGQGVKTACEFVAAVAIHEGKFGQGFPEYGPERSGAPMKGFTRISPDRIRQHCSVYHPGVVLVLDESLFESEDLCEGLGKDGVIIINTTTPAAAFTPVCAGIVWTVDATKIALDEIGRPIPNMPMVGALLRVTDILSLDSLIEGVRKEFSKKFSPKVIEGNCRAVKRAYDEVRRNG
ncbi:MAG: 2-oxoacid:acceptor oxidoreductase family protein [Candidatus Aureabacteria bacterium]|nr:2-oxoacid:acceptor oxidoreductase family protein [Candidatus Auribacterota bacterium]